MKCNFVFRISCFALFVIFISLFTSFAAEWKQSIGDRVWLFPEDHGKHPEYRTEWWYFTGNVTDKQGNRYGYQLTFFRQGVKKSVFPDNLRKENPWMVDDVYLAHFAMTDIGKGIFRHIDRTSRTGPGLAFAGTKGMDVHVLDWSAQMRNSLIHINARHQGMEINLGLKPGKPVILHGRKGLSIKGPAEGQSSYYYSFTDLKTSGHIKTPLHGESVEVKGVSWFDHEFGSNQLTPEQIGWDWFSVHLSDGRDLMLYIIRKKDGSIEVASSGTIVEKNGTSRHLKLADFQIDVIERWRSPGSKALYPCRWRVWIPSVHIDIILNSSVADQELITGVPARITYWEGVIEGKGTSNGRHVGAEGYVELTGYAGSLGGAF